MHSLRGVTLVELLITVVIGSIAFFALAVPFVSERSFWHLGSQQTEAQRDAQVALRAIARIARASSQYTITGARVTFTPTGPCANPPYVEGGQTLGNQLRLHTDCADPSQVITFIDGNLSQVTTWTPTSISARLVQLQVVVSHRLSLTDPTTRTEQLVTELFLRNAT